MEDKDTQNCRWLEKLAETIRERNLMARGSGVVAAVSGGADSVAMLAILRGLAARDEFAWRLVVAHLNHQIRPDADQDEAFVAGLAGRWGLPFVSARRDVPAEAAQQGATLEEAARNARYEFLLDAAMKNNCSCVAVAHHADDNAETILHRIVRGTHLRGLAGMSASRELGPGVQLVRPLLETTRQEIEAYLERNNLTWRTDTTNADTAFSRNCIRHEILPLLGKTLNPRVKDALLRLASSAGNVEAFLDGLAREAFDKATVRLPDGREALSVQSLVLQPGVLRSHVLRLALERAGVGMQHVGAEQLGQLCSLVEDDGPSAVCLAGGYSVRREGLFLVIQQGQATTQEGIAETPLTLPGETTLSDGRRVVCRVTPFDAEAFNAHCRRAQSGVELLDADCIQGTLVCRSRRDGDVFVPLGSPGRQSVSDFLTNAKTPGAHRRQVLCICDARGIIYVSPLRIDDRVKISGATQRVVQVAVCESGRQG